MERIIEEMRYSLDTYVDRVLGIYEANVNSWFRGDTSKIPSFTELKKLVSSLFEVVAAQALETGESRMTVNGHSRMEIGLKGNFGYMMFHGYFITRFR